MNLAHGWIINNSSTAVASAKVHVLSMDLEHASPKNTCTLAEQDDGTRFLLKADRSYCSVGRGCCKNPGVLTG